MHLQQHSNCTGYNLSQLSHYKLLQIQVQSSEVMTMAMPNAVLFHHDLLQDWHHGNEGMFMHVLNVPTRVCSHTHERAQALLPLFKAMMSLCVTCRS